MLEDFISQSLFSGAKDRAEVVSNLLIDANIRMGDILLFKEAVTEAIEFYQKAVDLCKEHFEGNERVMSSTLIMIGSTYQQINQLKEGTQAFQDSIHPLRAAIKKAMTDAKQSVANFDETSDQDLVKPSIFDSETVKDLKAMLIDILARLQENAD